MKKILIFLLLIASNAKSQTGCPLYSGITAWNNCINTTLINGANGGGTKLQVAMWLDTIAKYALLSSSGITTVGIASSNGFAGTSSGGTTPTITLRTTITGLLKGNGTAISAAVAGTDYQSALSGSGIVKSTSGTISYISGASTSFVKADGSLDASTYLSSTDLTTLPTANKGVKRDASANAFANNFISNVTTVVSSGGTTTLTAASSRTYRLTGSSNHTFKLPDATTLTNNTVFEFDNNSTGILTISDNSSGFVNSTKAGGLVRIALDDNSTAAGLWDVHFMIPSNGQWTTTEASITGNLDVTGNITSAAWNGDVITSSYIGSLTGGQVGISGLSATGTPSSSTYLRGDNTWATISGGMSNPMTTTGDIIYSSDNSGTPARLAIGLAGKFLIVSPANLPAYSTSTIPSNAGSTAGKLLKSDGTNYILSTSTFSDAPSTAGKIMVSDGTNWITSTPTFPNASATTRKKIVSDGTNWVASTETWATPSTSGFVLTSDGTNWISSLPAVTLTNTVTLTNKRITKRVDPQTSTSSYTPNIDNFDGTTFSGLSANLTINAPTGTPTDGQEYWIRIKSDATPRTLSFTTGAGGFRAGDAALPIITVASKTMYCGFKYNSTDNRYDLVAFINNF